MTRSPTTRAICAATALALGLCAVTARAALHEVAPGCGSLRNAYGPYDYRTDKSKLAIVEKFHFSEEGAIMHGGGYGLGGDLDYTLRAFPNHEMALMSIVNLAFQNRKAKAPTGAPKLVGMRYTVECYLIRAMAFRPDDGTVKLIYGIYLMRAGTPREAVKALEAAAKLRPDDPNVPYNLGLAYLDLGNYDAALASAHRAYALGFPLPGLRDRLKRAGKWREAPAAAPADSAGTAPAPAASAAPGASGSKSTENAQ
jgi:tetratricopeptide (TPR) repeat protein